MFRMVQGLECEASLLSQGTGVAPAVVPTSTAPLLRRGHKHTGLIGTRTHTVSDVEAVKAHAHTKSMPTSNSLHT